MPVLAGMAESACSLRSTDHNRLVEDAEVQMDLFWPALQDACFYMESLSRYRWDLWTAAVYGLSLFSGLVNEIRSVLTTQILATRQ